MNRLAWRRRRNWQLSIQSGRPPCAMTMVKSGKSTATSSRSIGSPYLLRAAGKIDVPVCTRIGTRSIEARSYSAASPGRSPPSR